MADVRDPQRDQPLPRPGKLPVQAIMIGAIEERREYGIRKYGRPLETDNGRDALKDAWEEALDLFTYLTQARLERGDQLPGMDRLQEPEDPDEGKGVDRRSLADALPRICLICRHEPHTPGHCRSQALNLGCSC